MPDWALPARNGNRSTVRNGLLAQSPYELFAEHFHMETLFFGSGSTNRANFLISAEYRDQVQTGARVAIRRLLGHQLIEIQADIRGMILGLPDELQSAHPQVRVLHPGSPFLVGSPREKRSGRHCRAA